MHNTPGRAVAIHPAGGHETAAFIFRAPARPNIRDQDTDQNKQLVIDTYNGMGWRVPELLDRVSDSEDLYFDSVSQIRLDSWARGRTVLVGDAANCISLLGEGSSMAITGAATLARELGAQPDEPATALHRTGTNRPTANSSPDPSAAARSHPTYSCPQPAQEPPCATSRSDCGPPSGRLPEPGRALPAEHDRPAPVVFSFLYRW